ncbi:hypothetical protein QPK87_24070 [Kamptonema cortianum]|nr:hypothetical protein [Kamptonema cortianum]
MNTVSAVVRVFQVEEGRWPSSLKEMVDKGYLTSLPPLPSGKKFAYDPKGGRVEVVNEGAPDIIPSNPSEDTEPATVRPSSILPPETPASSAPVEPSPGAIPQE